MVERIASFLKFQILKLTYNDYKISKHAYQSSYSVWIESHTFFFLALSELRS